MEKYIAFWTFDDVERSAIQREFGIRVIATDVKFISAWLSVNLYTDLWKLGLIKKVKL